LLWVDIKWLLVHVAHRSHVTSETQSTAHANLWLHPMVKQLSRRNTLDIFSNSGDVLCLKCLQIERAEEDGSVVFQDGSRVKADAILYCSG
jgi:hypothetical protein